MYNYLGLVLKHNADMLTLENNVMFRCPAQSHTRIFIFSYPKLILIKKD